MAPCKLTHNWGPLCSYHLFYIHQRALLSLELLLANVLVLMLGPNLNLGLNLNLMQTVVSHKGYYVV
jgi:hypothetical protein